MRKFSLPTPFALRKRLRLLLMLGLALTLSLILFSRFATVIDSTGWSSGFIHPLHGADHLLAMLAVGIWAAQLRGTAIWLLPVTFVGVMSLGGLAGAAGILLPGVEAIVLLSCLVFIGLITRRIRFSSQINIMIVAFFAFFHGFAHGQEISTSASLISYTLGFMVATLLLHGAGILVVRLCVLIVAFFISQLSFAFTATESGTTVNQTTMNSIDSFTLPETTSIDSRDYRQWNYSSANTTPPPTRVLQQHSYLANCMSVCVSVVLQTEQHLHDLATRVCHQPGKHFLTSGVGLASPPEVLSVNDLPRYSSALFFAPLAFYKRRLSLNAKRFILLDQRVNTLAIRFLSNGVGATSPPVYTYSAPVPALDSHEFASSNSTAITALFFLLHPSSKLTTRRPLRSAWALLRLIDRQR